MVDKNVLQKTPLVFKTSRQKKITVMTNSLIFFLLSLCIFGFYHYNNNFFKEKFLNQITTEDKKFTVSENMLEESLAEGKKLEFKNN